jgi:hypothetical protein
MRLSWLLHSRPRRLGSSLPLELSPVNGRRLCGGCTNEAAVVICFASARKRAKLAET